MQNIFFNTWVVMIFLCRKISHFSRVSVFFFFFFFFNDTATTEIYTLSLHDALPICGVLRRWLLLQPHLLAGLAHRRSEEHTSELQSQSNLVCRLLLEKKKKKHNHKAQPGEKKYAEQIRPAIRQG